MFSSATHPDDGLVEVSAEERQKVTPLLMAAHHLQAKVKVIASRIKNRIKHGLFFQAVLVESNRYER